VRRALTCDEPLRGLPRALRERALGRRRRLHRRQLPGLRLSEAERVRGPRLEPRLQDDRRRPRGGEGARRRALDAALSVPVRALRVGRPAPGVELAVSVVLNARGNPWFPRGPSVAVAGFDADKRWEPERVTPLA